MTTYTNTTSSLDVAGDSSWPPEITLDQTRVLNLLTGDRFYADASAALREAVLNAIDAVHRMKDQATEGFSPNIHVTFDQESLALEVCDNGIGMNQDDVESLFTKVGASAASTESNTGAVGEFGIGVISYFMAGNEFQLETMRQGESAIGLKFDKSLLAGGKAIQIKPSRAERGTTIRIWLQDTDTFDLLLDKLPFWCRDVDGLTAQKQPDGTEIPQRGLDQAETVDFSNLPDWVDRALLKPVSDPTGWEGMNEDSRIAVLYRGVFVQEFKAAGLWGIQGSIDVNPKRFKPSLNRESFVEREFEPDVTRFLESCHPSILKSMVTPLEIALKSKVLAKWRARRWATLWLSIPRTPPYQEVIKLWDSVFMRTPAFEMKIEREWQEVSLREIEQLECEIYVAPHEDEELDDKIEAAIRLICSKGGSVVRGIRRDDHWMERISMAYSTTADLILQVFSDLIPKLQQVSNVVGRMLNETTTESPLFTGPPRCDLVCLGQESAPILRLDDRLLVNIDHKNGMKVLEHTLEDNRGLPSLISGVARYAPDQLLDTAEGLANSNLNPEILSPIRRRFIRQQACL